MKRGAIRVALRGSAIRHGAYPLVLMILLGCAGEGSGPAPRQVAVGVDACAYCHMAVDDVARAAQWVPTAGASSIFDEPGCLVAWLLRNPGSQGRAYVADGATGAWIPAEEATYLQGTVRTGMGFDVVAYAAREKAGQRQAAGGGEVLTWAELNERGVRDAHAH